MQWSCHDVYILIPLYNSTKAVNLAIPHKTNSNKSILKWMGRFYGLNWMHRKTFYGLSTRETFLEEKLTSLLKYAFDWHFNSMKA